MVVTLEGFMLLLSQMVSLNKVVRITSPRTLNILAVLLSRSARTVLILRVKSQETRVTVGLLLVTPSGRSRNMELCLVPKE